MGAKFIQLGLLILVCFAFIDGKDLERVFKINLNDNLKTQYEPLITGRKDALKGFLNYLKNVTPKQLLQLIYSQYDTVKKVQPEEFIKRIEAIASVAGFDETDIFLANVVYEIFCTTVVVDSGIVIQETGLNEIFMGRNLDFNFRNFLGDLAYEGQYFRNGELAFKAQGMAGYVGILNGVRIGEFGVSINQRYNERNYEQTGRAFLKGDLSPAYLLLDVLQYSKNYSDATKRLSETKLTSPCYFTVAGKLKNEGVVITRSYERYEAETLDVDNGKWYLVQSNEDRDESYGRRKFTETNLNHLHDNKKDINYISLYDVMIKSPTRNENTIYTTIQSPVNDGHLTSSYW